jgi:putative heme degradation protein
LGKDFWPLASTAWERLVQLHALRGLLKANEVFEMVKRERAMKHVNSPWALDGDCLEKLDRDFHAKALSLAKVIPAEERWRFGL